jgi:predicted dehydrogenase
MIQRRRYSIVGTGGRSVMFIDALVKAHREYSLLVSMCDLSQVRMDYYNDYICNVPGHDSVSTYKPDQFEVMIEQTRPDTIIVCTMDSMHHEYIVRAMNAGCDVICEKPMTIDAVKIKAIYDAIERTGRSLVVTFNLRYTPLATKVRELIMQGVVGRPTAVDFSWMLDTSHGADYFRRWHREKDKSGGLLVHKSTHHFDLINWWIGGRPKTVYAMGDLKFYGQENAKARGEKYTYDRYTHTEGAEADPFALLLDGRQDSGGFDGGTLKSLYLDAEGETGYVRDRNVFGENISIEDTMAVMARYDNEVILNYSLVAYSPWEGFRAAITGDKGRIEVYVKHSSHILADQSDEALSIEQEKGYDEIMTVFPMFEQPYQVEVPKGVGGHGGGDPVLLEHLFSPNPPADPLNRAASHSDGAASILLGICANLSIETGRPVNCQDVFNLEATSNNTYIRGVR